MTLPARSSSIRHLQLLSEVTEAIDRATTVDEMFEVALDRLLEGVRADRASILLFDRAGVMRFRAWRGLSDRYRAAVEGHSPWSPDSPDPQPILVRDALRDADLEPHREILREEGVRGLAFVPLVRRERPIGKFMLYANIPRRFNPTEVALAVTVGRQIAFGVERMRAEQLGAEFSARIDRERRRIAELMANVPGVVWEAWGEPDAAHQRIDFVSHHVEAMLGYTVEEWLGTPNFWLGIVHPDDRERAAAEASAIFAGGREGVSQFRWIARDGRVVEVEAQSTVIRDDEGRPIGMRGVTMDITARRRVEEERATLIAREQEARATAEADAQVRALLESAPDSIVTFDRSGRIVIANSQTGRLFGYSRVELLGRNIELLLPEWAAGSDESGKDPLVGTGAATLDLVARRQDGSEFPSEVSLSPVETDDGLRITAVIRDVTERRRLQEQRAELLRRQIEQIEAERSQRRSQFLADASRLLSSSLEYPATLAELVRMAVPFLGDWCVIDLADKDGSLRRVASGHADPGASALLERAAVRTPAAMTALLGEVVASGEPRLVDEAGDPWAAFLPGLPGEPGAAALAEALAPGSAIVVPLVARRVLGVITCARRHPHGYAVEDLGFVQDLARRIGSAIENARLYREAQEANRVKDEFLATLSHELRTPLSAILGWAHLLRSGTLPPDRVEQAVATIERNARMQTQLIADILDLSRITTGRLTLNVQRLELGAIVDAALETMRPAAEARGVRLEASIEGPIVLTADPDRLQQIVWNLLSNAVKFTEHDGRVRVEAAQDGSVVRLRVRDDGLGITPEFLPFVFERFRQADASTTRMRGGLGLGLAITRHLVELHGGAIEAASDGPGTGATFTLTLPIRPIAARPVFEEARTAVAEPERRASPTSISGLHVLVVDDEPDVREFVKAVLVLQGASVAVASSVGEAFEQLAVKRPDVLLVDIAMPGEDGYSLIRRLRAEPEDRGRDVPAIALTAYVRDQDRRQALESGFQLHLGKPIEPDLLFRGIAQLAGRLEPLIQA